MFEHWDYYSHRFYWQLVLHVLAVQLLFSYFQFSFHSCYCLSWILGVLMGGCFTRSLCNEWDMMQRMNNTLSKLLHNTWSSCLSWFDMLLCYESLPICLIAFSQLLLTLMPRLCRSCNLRTRANIQHIASQTASTQHSQHRFAAYIEVFLLA